MNKFGFKTNRMHRMIAAALCVAMLMGMIFQVTLFSAPEGEKEEPEQAVTRVADVSTINSWQEYFGSETDTSNAGKIWTDKTVMVTAPELVECKDTTTLAPQEDNFLVGLSALSSNKTVTGEAALPVDVVFVVDISDSMVTIALDGEPRIVPTVRILNWAIQEILDLNEKNRVGVVLYSGSEKDDQNSETTTATCPMPLGRYQNTVNEGIYFSLDENDVSQLQVDSGVECTSGNENFNKDWKKTVIGYTYMQNGLMEALDIFGGLEENSEEKEERVPVITLLSDGAPTAVREEYADRGASTIGLGEKTDLRRTFLTQLTAAWVKANLKSLYPKKEPLFYSIGLVTEEQSDSEYARMVLNPKIIDEEETDKHNNLKQWWEQFLSSNIGEIETYVTTTQDLQEEVQIKKEDGLITDKEYVDEYFEPVNQKELQSAFANIIEKISLYSGNYPTDVGEGNPNYSGYLTFQDDIGEYMHVEDMKGVMYDGELHNGKNFADIMSNENLGSLSDEGKAFLDSLVATLGIDMSMAEQLFENAKNTGQIASTDTGYSNYIGWYADESGKCIGAYVEGEEVPSNAVTINKSYFYYGESVGTLEKENMMYLVVRVAEKIATQEQTVHFSIPASLIPMTQYNVTKSVEENQETKAELEQIPAYPIHLFYEVGVDEEIDEYDWSKVRDDYPFRQQTETLRECKFYANAWDNISKEAKASMEFKPSEKNDFYYYTENAQIYEKDGESENGYRPYTGEPPSNTQTYYYRQLVYTASGMKEVFEKIDETTLNTAISEDNNWFIPKGTLKYSAATETVFKENAINGIEYVRKASVLTNMYSDNGTKIGVALGNNGEFGFRQGKLLVKKQVKDNAYAEGHDDDTSFEFEMTLEPLKTESNVKKVLEEGEENFIVHEVQDGKNDFQLKNQEYRTYWLPLGQTVSVEEEGKASKEYRTSVIITQKKQTFSSEKNEKKGEVTISELESTILFVNDYTAFTTQFSLTKYGDNGERLSRAVFNLYKCGVLEPKAPDKPQPPNDPSDPDYQDKYEEYQKEYEEYKKEYEEYLTQYEEYKKHIQTEHNKILDDRTKEKTCWELIGTGTSIMSGVVNFYDVKNEENPKAILSLRKGEYRLIETKAPDEYMKPEGQWNIKIVPGGNVRFTFSEVRGENGARPPAISEMDENSFKVQNYKPINPPITGGRGIDRFLILGAAVTISGLMITVHLVLQRKRGKL